MDMEERLMEESRLEKDERKGRGRGAEVCHDGREIRKWEGH